MKRATQKEIARPIPAKTLRELCIERGVNPEDTGYKVPKQRFLALDRLIPGVPDREAPSVQCAKIPQHGGNARKMYTRSSAANDTQQIADGGTEAYVAAFCRLNNLTEEC